MADDRDYAAELMARIEHLENHIEDVAKDTHKIMVAYEAALPASYRLGLAAGAIWLKERSEVELEYGHIADAAKTRNYSAAIRATPTPTPAELMARINEGEKK